jgi:hypothetical protein
MVAGGLVLLTYLVREGGNGFRDDKKGREKDCSSDKNEQNVEAS